MDRSDADLLEPNADIHGLFHHYNSLYFHGALVSCFVNWSTSRMTRYTGACRYQPRGGCEIRLSEPLLKFASIANVKNTLLHEMIHAYLYVKDNNKDHSDHGSSFQHLMDIINSNSVDDLQRPVGGYNITFYHELKGEFDSKGFHYLACESCGDLIKRAINREPPATDCLEKVKHDGPCGNPLCHWHSHKMSCSGSYKKIAESSDYEGKNSHSKGKQGLKKGKPKESPHVTGQQAIKQHSGIDIKEETEIKDSERIAENLNAGDRSLNVISDKDHKYEEFEVIDLKTHYLAVPKQAPRSKRIVLDKKRKRGGVVLDKFEICKCKYTVMSEWLDLYVDEEVEDENIEPLINKRTERRRKQKLLKNKILQVTDDDMMAGASPSQTSCNTGNRDVKLAIEYASNDPENSGQSISLIPVEDRENVMDISSD